ncbi:MAG: lactate racemase domain-containing protein [Desulfobacterales bacterium]
MRVRLPQLLWYENNTLEIDLPDDWDVEICPMQGADRPPLTVGQMEAAILNPIESTSIRDIAKGKKTAVIVFDDMTRPTRTYEIAPIVLKELEAGGIKKHDITFVCALGAHGALTQIELRKKLGSTILENYRVFNHNPYENCVHAGTTSYGTPVMFNREVMEADVKIGIGCVTAHPQAGFSGGGKLLLPGVAHIDTISHYHLEVAAKAPETMGLGKYKDNILRKNIREAAAMAGMDFTVNVIFNDRGCTTAVFAGDIFAAHAQAVELAKSVYETSLSSPGKDLVIANAFAKANEMTIATRLGVNALGGTKGTVVVIANSPEGQVVHYLLGRFGRNYGGRQYPVTKVPHDLDLIIMAPYFGKNFADWFANPEAVTFTRDWQATMDILKNKFGANTKVAVVPNATMQY